jgi:hypothetical protein
MLSSNEDKEEERYVQFEDITKPYRFLTVTVATRITDDELVVPPLGPAEL